MVDYFNGCDASYIDLRVVYKATAATIFIE